MNENEILDMQKGDKANVLRKLSESGKFEIFVVWEYEKTKQNYISLEMSMIEFVKPTFTNI